MKRHAVDLLAVRPETRRPHSAAVPRAYGAALPPRTAADGRTAPAGALRVLVVESEARAAHSLVQGLLRQGYEADSVATGGAALQAHRDVDLVLLDLDLPDLDGLEVCRAVRAVSDTPVIAVTARGSELDRVLGLQAGADDYLVKPYGFRELLARMEAVMRRVRLRPAAVSRVIDQGPLRIDAGTRVTTLGGTTVDLTRKEFDLLYLLASQPGTVVSRRRLLTEVWDDAWSQRGRTLDTHVSSVRGKLGSSSWIITVRGVGFRIGQP
ncbi:response regulator transcription factor [Streptomyces bambusae]|uniref:response regulator transcription factor n=1 Tax=Streptomyces bambusae TaxID=1550616 RepID=UPI001CFFDAB8|nr:response regulator transcription factor [Streptomyces bambusae]MCB5169616.1 response regulator transcription factor [Streptomyces bambusae]